MKPDLLPQSIPVKGIRSVSLSTSSGSVPVFMNRIPGSVDELALFSLSGPLDEKVIATSLVPHMAPGNSVRGALFAFEGLCVPGLIVCTGSAHAAEVVYSIMSKAPAVVDGALVGLRGMRGAEITKPPRNRFNEMCTAVFLFRYVALDWSLFSCSMALKSRVRQGGPS